MAVGDPPWERSDSSADPTRTSELRAGRRPFPPPRHKTHRRRGAMQTARFAEGNIRLSGCGSEKAAYLWRQGALPLSYPARRGS